MEARKPSEKALNQYEADNEKVSAAEKAIQKILLDLEHDVRPIEAVNIDCRRFANCSVNIWMTEV